MNVRWLLVVLGTRRTRTAADARRDLMWTSATALTVLRALVGATILGLAWIDQSRALLLASLTTNYVFDACDGPLARFTHTETVFGAQIDGLVDRFITSLVLIVVTTFDNSVVTLIGVIAVWGQVGIVDAFMANQFPSLQSVVSRSFLRGGRTYLVGKLVCAWEDAELFADHFDSCEHFAIDPGDDCFDDANRPARTHVWASCPPRGATPQRKPRGR